MINLASLMFSTIMVIYVIIRAIKLDNVLPWFGPATDAAKPAAGVGSGKTAATNGQRRQTHGRQR
jgi:hypothetical protein